MFLIWLICSIVSTILTMCCRKIYSNFLDRFDWFFHLLITVQKYFRMKKVAQLAFLSWKKIPYNVAAVNFFELIIDDLESFSFDAKKYYLKTIYYCNAINNKKLFIAHFLEKFFKIWTKLSKFFLTKLIKAWKRTFECVKHYLKCAQN